MGTLGRSKKKSRRRQGNLFVLGRCSPTLLAPVKDFSRLFSTSFRTFLFSGSESSLPLHAAFIFILIITEPISPHGISVMDNARRKRRYLIEVVLIGRRGKIK